MSSKGDTLAAQAVPFSTNPPALPEVDDDHDLDLRNARALPARTFRAGPRKPPVLEQTKVSPKKKPPRQQA
ncbi:MAG: hypothetical protein ACREDD_07100 [Methylocella sp.]